MGQLRQIIVIEGPLAYRMQRAAAARANAVGRDVMSLPQLAARLAGGFVSSVTPEILYPAIADALLQGGFADLQAVIALPGMPRAVADTLLQVWKSDLDLRQLSSANRRLGDVALLVDRIRAILPRPWLTPPDLRDAAIARVRHAKTLLGSVHMEMICYVDPLWRPLLKALAAEVEVTWSAPATSDTGWFSGDVIPCVAARQVLRGADSCADPRSEVVEALRWVRQHLSSGTVRAAQIAVSAASTAHYDEHFLVLREQGGLPINFSHGLPALSTSAGQVCAALADVLLKGLDQDRVRRLLRSLPETPLSRLIPSDWATGLRAGAGLFSVQHWQGALANARPARQSGEGAETALMPLLRLIERGTSAAGEIGDLLLRGESFAIWQRALRSAPPEALGLSLQQLRVPDNESDPATSVTWCPSDHLAASPRPIIRLLGLSVGSWPRTESDDPLIPDHVLSRRRFRPVSLTERDRVAFAVISHQAEQLTVSMARRSARGGLQSPSPLWIKANQRELGRLRVPEHAMSENDRLLARPFDAKSNEAVIRTRELWRAWQRRDLSRHDGLLEKDHPVVLAALQHTHSATSLRLLLRDPQAYFWSHGLGWWPKDLDVRPLSLSPLDFGELVHEIMATGIRRLDQLGGVQDSSLADRIQALTHAVAEIAQRWPLERATPPGLLWTAALETAQQMVLNAINADDDGPQRVRSWTEVTFGDPHQTDAPWSFEPVMLPGTGIAVSGRIDRLDLADNRSAVRITDYKTSRLGRENRGIVIAGGKEVQRVLYAAAARQLLSDVPRVVARLTYLKDQAESEVLAGEQLESAIAGLSGFAAVAQSLLTDGRSFPGPDASDNFSRYRLARPAEFQRYRNIKAGAVDEAFSSLMYGWSLP